MNLLFWGVLLLYSVEYICSAPNTVHAYPLFTVYYPKSTRKCFLRFISIGALAFVMPPLLGAGGIMFSGCPSVRPSEAWNTLFWPVHGSVGPPDQPWPFYGMSVRPSVRPSGEVSGHLPENAWRKWPEILHADVSWPSSELISSWTQSVDFSNFGTILT